MSHASSLTSPLHSTFWPKDNSLIKQTLLILAGVILLAIASQLSVPLRPIPLTFQSATVILIGMAYGPRYGTYVVGLYLLAGLCGIPVFASFSAGPATFFGPTCGYLVGFFPAAFVSGYLAKTGWAKSIGGSFLAACLGTLIIFACGVLILAQAVGWKEAFEFGVLPFVVSEPIKLLAVSCVIPRLWKKPTDGN